jgi:hypothetical protein
MFGLIYSPSEDADLSIGLRRAVNSGEADWAVTVGATFRW